MSWFGKKEQNTKEEIITTPEQITKRAIVVWFIGCENGFTVNCASKELALE